MPTKAEAIDYINESWTLAKRTAREIRLERGASAHRGKYPWEEGVPWELLNVRSYVEYRNELLKILLDSEAGPG